MQTVADPTADLWAAAESDPAPWAGTAMADVDADAVAPWDTEAQATEDTPAATAERESGDGETEADAVPEAAAEADAEATAQDPYDADAPVLADVEPMAASTWDSWSPNGVSAVAPLALAGRQLSPTPPDGLFDQSVGMWAEDESEPFVATAADSTDAVAEADVPGTAEVVDAPDTTVDNSIVPQPVPQQPVPASLIIATGPGGEQQLVLRIELAIVDPSNKLRPADEARRVGPWSDDEPVTPRHPEYEPRTHLSSVDEADDDSSADKANDPWALPPLAEPNPTASWVLDSPAHDPLADLPAASFVPTAPAAPAAPAEPTTAPVAQQFVPAVQPSAAAKQSPVPAATVAPAPATAPATHSAANDQSDLWFLASEPTVEPTNNDSAAATTTQSSSMATVGLTVVMAVAVIFLVLVFIYMMTSLLH
jgi:hypothetical protein